MREELGLVATDADTTSDEEIYQSPKIMVDGKKEKRKRAPAPKKKK